MISLDVNGFDRDVSDSAHVKLNRLYVPWGKPVCAFNSITSPHWGCTREAGHTGVHVAHGIDADGSPDAYAVFVIGDPDHYGG